MQTDPLLLDRAKRMRTEMTQPEREFWTAVRGKRFGDVKFTRQMVIGRLIVDFAVRSRGLAIEIDGDTHDDEARDHARSLELARLGFRVLRFSNADVMSNLEGVLTTLASALAAAPLPTLSPEGRGLKDSLC